MYSTDYMGGSNYLLLINGWTDARMRLEIMNYTL